MNNTQRFQRDLAKCGVVEGEKILVACSGGADSMLLAHALRISGHNIEVAHVNFMLRGEESNGDESLVRRWCEENHIPFHTRKLNPKDSEFTSGTQDAARKLRYSYFEEVRDQIGALHIAVAHHENDQAETLILHLLRAVNTSALGCMSNRTGDIIRPLLNWSKEDILEWISADNVEFRDDSSNTSKKYTRNRIRHEVLPLLEDIRKGSVNHLAEWTTRLRIQSNAVDSAISEASRDILEYNIDLSSNIICKIKLEPLGESKWGMMIFDRLLSERGWPVGTREEASILQRASVGSIVSFGNDELRRERDHIALSIQGPSENSHVILNKELISDPQGMNIPTSPNILWVGQSSLEGPTVWRPWEHGDKLHPSGMEGSVKVSDLLTQWKVPNSSRKNAHVLVDSTCEILWVFILFEGQSISRISNKVNVKLGEPIIAFTALIP